MTVPVFAVVGHPNKGKSSIVSTLTRQDAVRISELSGTTTQAQSFQLNLNGQCQYELVDTPGFQRPRQVLHELEQSAVNAAGRPAAVKAFLSRQQAQPDSSYTDEVELLTPVMAGAGVIYVVDGAMPYSAEYEAEMTILQWTGQPRMALINPIGGEDYVDQWRDALSQFFSVVRVFDPLTADDQKQRAVLSAFAELYDPWRVPLELAIDRIRQHDTRQHQQCAQVISRHLVEMIGHTSDVKVPMDFAEASLKAHLRIKYQQSLRDLEAQAQRELQTLYAHLYLRTEGDRLDADYPDLFDEDAWYLFGLDRTRLVALSGSAGAAAGVAIDVGVGGSSLMLGALAGGLLSSAASFAATWKPTSLKVRGVPVAGKRLVAGPIKNLQFCFVILGRLLAFADAVRFRTHADRSVVQLQDVGVKERMNRLSRTEQVRLTRLLQKANKGLSEKEMLQLEQTITMLQQPEPVNSPE
ncbi:GTPase/DUF3482 domain-containing protein [Reinekea blandensis]|uniref:GTP-binding protein, HSR1-related n=1 Tax=Reinekea blandensis MED297 TaxID=314283 RepID=A4BI59_9GAMM|nr:GTPase/DUF3482 domain-containing protein [Reinekea blandensis]EAR08202.1 GTP-binding protein, HSR1-related [Reinekea sp. MED297] [Reinekea blandensis MED297]